MKNQIRTQLFVFTVLIMSQLQLHGAGNEPVVPEQELVHKQYCLSIDGGGLRGAFPAGIIRQIELGTKAKISTLFKGGITGTSTGALIALGLSARKNLDEINPDYNVPLFEGSELVDFYKDHAHGIFKCWTPANCCNNVADCSDGACSFITESVWNMLTCFGCFGCCYNCRGACGPQYSNEYLRTELVRVFGKRRLKDVVVPVQIVTYDATSNEPLYLNSIDHGEVLMVDAALASSAAPTFFPPYKFENPADRGVYHRCIDGGVYDNNPVLAALRFAVEIYRKNEGKDADIRHFKLASIGTGYTPTVINFERLVKSGKLGWASPVIQMGMDGTSTASHLSMESIFGKRKDGKHYYRIQPSLPEQYSQMDDPKVVEYLCSIVSREAGKVDFSSLLVDLNRHQMLADDEVRAVDNPEDKADIVAHFRQMHSERAPNAVAQ